MDLFIDICGWIGAISYSIYTIPQALDAYKKGKTEGLSAGMILLLFFGALLSLIYIIPDITSPLFYNFTISLVATSVILKYHFLPRK